MPVFLHALEFQHRHLRSRLAHSGKLVLFVVLLAIARQASSSEAIASQQKADRIVIVKSTRTLTLLNHGQVLKTIQLGRRLKQATRKRLRAST
jgi:CRP-like cAMP-binding protein